MNKRHVENLNKNIFIYILAFSLMLVTLITGQTMLNNSKASAACASPGQDYGVVTQNIDVKSASNYRAWVRIKAPNNTNNSILLEINGNCYKMGDKAISSGQWVWVDYQDGNTNKKANVDLRAGQQTVKLIGNEPNVRVDKVIFTTYKECVPLKATDECAPPDDTTNPTVSISSPQNNAKVSGTIDINTNVNDNAGIKKVDFLVDGSVVGSDTQPPYSYKLDTTKLSEGNHSVIAKATDTSDNFKNSTQITVNVANNKPDIIVTSLTWTPLSPKANDEVTFKATLKNNSQTPVTDANNVKVEFKVDGETVTVSERSIQKLSAGQSIIFTANQSVDGNNSTWTATPGSHTILAIADSSKVIDESKEDNNQLSVTTEVASLDTLPPIVNITSPTSEGFLNGETVIRTEASDQGTSLLSRVEFYIGNKLVGTDNEAPYEYTWNTNNYEDKFYEIKARVYDNAGNSANSEVVQVEVLNNPVEVDIIEEDDPIEDQPTTTEDENGSEQPVFVPLESVTVLNVDIDGDEIVNEYDLSLFFVEWGQQSSTTTLNVDFNSDGIVNVFDLSILLSNWSF